MTYGGSSAASALRGRVPSGYGRLDEALRGGFLAGSMIVLTAPASDEVPTLLGNFLKSEQPSLLVCRNLSYAQAIVQDAADGMRCLICSDKPISSARGVLPGKGIENLTDLNLQINEALVSIQPKRVVLAILSDVLLRHKALQTRKWLNELLEKLRSRGITTLAILNSYMHTTEETQAVVDLFDANIEVFEREVEGRLGKFLRIKWVYGIEVSQREFPLEVPVAEKAGPDELRIAVLPFANFSPDPNDEYFADGITEEVISTLSKIQGFAVISRTSVMQYKKTPKSIKAVSRELEAGMILEGSVRKAGNRLRVTVQIIDAAKDRHMWAESYDRDYQDIFAIQSDIARQVADALSVKVLPGEKVELAKKPTENTTAYTLYLKGRYLWNKGGGEAGLPYEGEAGEEKSVKKALECFEQSVKEDPRFALGYVGQADCYLTLRGGDQTSLQAGLKKAKTMVAKALELDPGLAEAHATKGLVLMDEYDFRQAEEQFRRAIELKPNYALAHQWYSYIFFHQQRWDEGLEENEKAVELDPLSPGAIFNQAHMYYHMKDYGKALELWKRVTTLEPGHVEAHWMMAQLYVQMKMVEDVRREATIWAELVRGSFPLVGIIVDFIIALAEGDTQTMRMLAPEVEAHFKEAGLGAYNVAATFFLIGENDKGFEWLERCYSWRDPTILEMKCDQETMHRVRTDPRYLDLLRRLGL